MTNINKTRPEHKKGGYNIWGNCSSSSCIADGAEEGLTVLTNELNNEDEWVRLNAALVFDELGEKSRSAIPSLKSVMADKNQCVVRVVNHALNFLLDTENEVK